MARKVPKEMTPEDKEVWRGLSLRNRQRDILRTSDDQDARAILKERTFRDSHHGARRDQYGMKE